MNHKQKYEKKKDKILKNKASQVSKRLKNKANQVRRRWTKKQFAWAKNLCSSEPSPLKKKKKADTKLCITKYVSKNKRKKELNRKSKSSKINLSKF